MIKKNPIFFTNYYSGAHGLYLFLLVLVGHLSKTCKNVKETPKVYLPQLCIYSLKKGNLKSSFSVSNSEVQPNIWGGAIQVSIF